MTRAGEKLYGDWNRANGIDPNAQEASAPPRRRFRDGVAIIGFALVTMWIFGGSLYALLS